MTLLSVIINQLSKASDIKLDHFMDKIKSVKMMRVFPTVMATQ